MEKAVCVIANDRVVGRSYETLLANHRGPYYQSRTSFGHFLIRPRIYESAKIKCLSADRSSRLRGNIVLPNGNDIFGGGMVLAFLAAASCAWTKILFGYQTFPDYRRLIFCFLPSRRKKIKEITAVTTNRGETDFAITLIGAAFRPRKLRSLQ